MAAGYICLARKYRPQSFGLIPDDPDNEFVARVLQIMGGNGVDISLDAAIEHASDEFGYRMHPNARRQVADKWIGDTKNG